MAIRLPKPKKKLNPVQIEPQFDSLPNPDLFQHNEVESSTTIIPLSDLQQGYNNSRFYDWDGRVNRIQFLAYTTFIALVGMLMLVLLFISLGGIVGIIKDGASQLPVSVMLIVGLVLAAMTYLQFAVTKRRFNDMNKTGWLALIMGVPLINIFAYLYLLGIEGSHGTNYYGLPARPSANLKTVVMVLIPLMVISLLAIITQVVQPSYQEFVNNGAKNTKTETSQLIKPSQVAPTNAQVLPASASQPETLRTEAVVITGEQLGNGVASALVQPSANQPVATEIINANNANNPASVPNANIPNNQAMVPTNANDVAINTASPSIDANDDIDRASKGVISYEEFVKTSETPVFVDKQTMVKK